MAKQAFVVTGLGYGDEGKGTTTHWLSERHKAHTVIRTGGPQALHRVVCKDGTDHVFSQFGSGTPRGAATHLSRHMLIDPHAILREGDELRHEHGFNFVFETMTIHEDALVITPFQAIAGRVRELLRGKNRYGSVGIGVGETILDAEILCDRAIRVKDLDRPYLREKLEVIRQYKWAQFGEFADRASDIPADVADSVRKELAEMEDLDTVQWAVERFTDLVKRVKIVDTSYVAERILRQEGTVVFEGSQGVLLDRYHGFHPYTTKVRATPATAVEILRDCGYDGEIKSLGVLRAYHTRHGGGPFVTESKELTKQLPDVSNKEHAWQGSFRVGHFDMVAARYAIKACGEGSIDGLIITCIDRIVARGKWDVCMSYHYKGALGESTVEELPVHREACLSEQLKKQKFLGQFLGDCTPHLNTINFFRRGKKDVCIETVAKILTSGLKLPIVAMSLGESEKDKIEF